MSDTVEKVASLAYQMGQMQLMLDQQKSAMEQQAQRMEADAGVIRELRQELDALRKKLGVSRVID